jgi:ATP-dependent DNA helicase 2 subunit 1
MSKDAVLFCIDVSESMMQQPEPSDDKKADRDSPTLAALKCAYQLMQQRIISNPNDMMGVLLFGTEKSRFMGEDEIQRSKIAYPHCYLLTDLDVPAAADVKALRTLVEDEEEAAQLLIPSEEPVAISNVLFCANQIFTTRAANFSSRRLFLVTDNDNPHSHDKALRSAAAVRAKDLYDLGVIIELFPIAKPGYGFDRTKFYDDIVYRAQPGDDNAPAPFSSAAKTSESRGGISLLQSLISNINSKAAPRRALFTLPFEIGPGLKIGVKGYVTLKHQEALRSCYIWLGGEKPQLAVGSTTKIAEDTARTVEQVEIRKAFKFGGETINFTEDELKKIKTFGDPGIRIIGFKDLKLLPIWANTKPATFIYPSDVDYIGSTRVFSALYQKLQQAKKFALVWFIPRKNSEPRLAAAVPSEEKYNEDGEQVCPQGLWLIHLPFADDIRKTPDLGDNGLVAAPDSLIDLMRKVVQQLQLPKGIYEPKKYPNPALQWFYRILQAIALEAEIPEKAEDKTLPRYRQIDKRAGPYVVEWGEELEKQYGLWQKEHGGHGSLAAVGSKRTADGSVGGPSKKAKTKDEAHMPTEEDMREKFNKGTIDKLTLPLLKGFCQAKKLPVTGKKADFVERINEYFETK